MCENQSKSSRPKSSDKNTSRKEEDVPLDEIVENVSSYLKKFSHFKKYEKDIKKKYQKYYKTTEALPDCWSHDFINKAWRKTETMHKFTGRKKCWSLAILLQVMKRSRGYDENDREAQTDVKKENPQSGGDPSANEAKKPVYIRIPFSEMINGKECYRKDTDSNIIAMDIESKFSDTDEKDKESKASESVAMDIIESPKIEEYKLIDKVPSPTQILQNQFYITLYDNQTRNAAWVYEILNESTLPEKKITQQGSFKRDKSVHEYFQAPDGEKPYSGTGYGKKKTQKVLFKRDKSDHEDFRTPDGEHTYKGTTYDRGHLAAAANHGWCKEAYKDTYCLSNAVPQQSGFNRGIWLTLENLCRYIAQTKEVRNVHVYTGPLYPSSGKVSKDNNDQNKSNELDDDINDQNKSYKLDDDVNDQNKRKKLMDDNNYQKKRKNPEENIVGEKANKNDPDESKKRVEYKFVGGKAVPTHLFKVIIVENDKGKVLAPECYKIPNEKPPDQEKVPNASPKGKLTTEEKIEKCRSELKKYKEKIEVIQRESGLIFEEREVKEESKDNQRNSRLKEEITDETWKMKWTAENRVIWIEVSVSGSYTDHSDRAVLH